MKIGIVTTWFERGAAYVSRQYADVLRNAGHEVFVFARGGERYAKEDPNWDFDWVYWGKKTWFRDRLGMDFRDFKKWLIKNRIELVIFNEQITWDPVFLCQNMGIKTVAYIDYYKENEVPLFANYDGLICNTERHYSVFNWHPGALYIPWGTDTKLFSPENSSFELVTSDCVTFFHSAGMSPGRKGTDFLIRAFSQIQGNSRLIIHSQVDLKQKLPDIAGVIAGLEGRGRLECIIKTVPAPGLYHLGDVYVYPARLDGIGLTVCEAMACGLPAIVPDNGPMNEFVPSNDVGARVKIDRLVSRYDGYYWPQCWTNVEDLAGKMQFYVDHPDRVLTAKQAALKYVRGNRDWLLNTSQLGAQMEALKKCYKCVPVRLESALVRLAKNLHSSVRMSLKSVMIKLGIFEVN